MAMSSSVSGMGVIWLGCILRIQETKCLGYPFFIFFMWITSFPLLSSSQIFCALLSGSVGGLPVYSGFVDSAVPLHQHVHAGT